MKAFIVALLIANTGIDDMYYRYNPAGGWAEACRLAQDNIDAAYVRAWRHVTMTFGGQSAADIHPQVISNDRS